MSFEPVFTYVMAEFPMIAVNPGRTVQACRVIQEWIDAGCNQQDMLETIKQTVKTKKDVTSLNYFTKPILAAKDKRTGGQDHQLRIAQGFAWLRDRYPARYEVEGQRFLEAYEAKHGRVEPRGKANG